MKLATLALAIAFALPTTFARAEGPMNLADPVVRPVVGADTIDAARPMVFRPRNPSGSAFARIMHDPGGSTSTLSAMRRGS